MTTHNCDLCGSDKFTVLEAALPYIGTEQPPVVCKDCGFIYVRERRSSEEIIASWKSIYANSGYDPNWPGVRARLFYVAEWISQNFMGQGAKHFDLGGGDGWFSSEMTRRGWRSTTADPAFEGGAKDVTPGQFDVVTLNWTLENCVDCIGLLKEAKRLLKQNGHVVVATGSRIRVPTRKLLRSYFGTNPADTHAFRWSRLSLSRALQIAGFSEPMLNDYEQNDVLLACAKSIERPLVPPILNEHNAVLTHFKLWADTWA